MKTIPALAVMALMLGTAVGDVVAGRGYHDGWAPRHAAGYGKVIRVKPVYKVVEVSVPEEDCSDARIANTAGEPERAALAGAFVGGIVGAVAGNQFGKGDGRVVMTVAGTVVGATVGYRAGPGVAELAPDIQWTYRHCETVDRLETREELVGYRVKYRYRGHMYHMRTDQHPGKRIRVDRGAHPIHF